MRIELLKELWSGTQRGLVALYECQDKPESRAHLKKHLIKPISVFPIQLNKLPSRSRKEFEVAQQGLIPFSSQKISSLQPIFAPLPSTRCGVTGPTT